MLKYLKDNSVVISAFLIFIAATKQYLYYIDFNINIINYLSLGELLTSIFDDIYLYLMLVTLVLLQAFISGIFFKFMGKYKYINNFEKSMDSIDIDYKFFGTLLVVLSISVYASIMNYNVNVAWIYLILLGALQAAILWPFFIRRFEEKKELTNIEALTTLFLVFFLFALFMARFEVASAKRQESDVTVIGQDTIICNKKTNLIFLGNTQDYIFIYDLKNKASKSIKMDGIRIIERK